MKRYYFMNKAEILEKDVYENPLGRVQYYYDRDARTEKREQALQRNTCRRSIERKRRKYAYIFSALMLIAMYFIYRYWGS